MPVIWPRSSLTLIEPEVCSAMDRLGIEFEDCFWGRQHLIEKAFHHSKKPKAEEILEGMRRRVDEVFTEIRPLVEEMDATLGPAMDTARKKIFHQLDALQARFIRLESSQDESLIEKVYLVLSQCFPNKYLQERELSVHHFIARHGPSLLDAIYSHVQMDTFTHQVIRLDPGPNPQPQQ